MNNMYFKEIKLMMHGFGDISEPLADTVRLVECVTLKQIRGILYDAFEEADRRGSDTIELTDIVFLMRHNSNALRRLQRFIKNKYSKRPNANIQIGGELLDVTNNSVTRTKEIEKVTQAVEAIDETGELTNLDIFDPIKYQRQLRADRISVSLDETKYMEYYKARCASFMNRETALSQNIENFKRWLLPNDDKINLSTLIVDILSYFAFETVATIVDLTLTVRNDVNRKVNDPLVGLSATQEWQSAITPADVREALRRYEMSQIGSFMSSSCARTRRPYLVF